MFAILRRIIRDGSADDAQAFVGTGGHGQRERLAMDAEMPQIALAPHVCDLDAVTGEEADDVLIAGVTAHGWWRMDASTKEKGNDASLPSSVDFVGTHFQNDPAME